MHCSNFDMQAKLVVSSCFLIKFFSCLWLIKEAFKTTISVIWKIILFSMMLKDIFFELFIICFLFKGYNKDQCIELVMWFHNKSFVPYLLKQAHKKIYFWHKSFISKNSYYLHYVDSKIYLVGLWIIYRTWEMQL